VLHLALDGEPAARRAEQLRHPGAGGKEQALRLVRAARRSDPNTLAGGLPPCERLVELQLDAPGRGVPQGRGHGSLGIDPARARFEDGDRRVQVVEQGIAAGERRGIENLVFDAVLTGARQRTADDLSALRADVEHAGDVEQRGLRRRFETPPVLVGASRERHVPRMLERRLADDTRAAVARAHGVGRMKTIEPQDAETAAAQMDCRRAADGAESGEDDVVGHGDNLASNPDARGQ